MHTVFKIDQPRNHPIYAIDQEFGCLQLSSNQTHENQVKIEDVIESLVPNQTDVWKIFFDGSCTKDRAGAGVVLISPEKKKISPNHANSTSKLQIMWLNIKRSFWLCN